MASVGLMGWWAPGSETGTGYCTKVATVQAVRLAMAAGQSVAIRGFSNQFWWNGSADDDRCAVGNAVIKVDDILVHHADATAGYGLADRPVFRRAMNSEQRVDPA